MTQKKLGPMRISRALRNHKGDVSCFFKCVRVKDSNEVKVLAILKALPDFSLYFQGLLVVEATL